MVTVLETYDIEDIQLKLKKIGKLLADKKVIVAFSGGVDSSVMAYLSKKYARETKLMMQIGNSVAIGEKKIAQKQADQLDLPLQFLEYDEVDLSDPYAENSENRCYFCKQLLYDFLITEKNISNFDLIVSGTNFSDLGGHRPGLKAAKEFGVLEPLAIAKITKQEVRWIAQDANLNVWDKPASACLASRFVTGIKITKEDLQRVAESEFYIKNKYSIRILRVRHHGDLARIETSIGEMQYLLKPDVFSDIQEKLESLGYRHVTIDMKGYRPAVPPTYNSNN